MEWCRTRRKGGVSQYLTIQGYDARETLRFGCVFVCKLPIDRRGPITEGMWVLPVQPTSRPFLRTGPADGFARAQVDDRCTVEQAREVGKMVGH